MAQGDVATTERVGAEGGAEVAPSHTLRDGNKSASAYMMLDAWRGFAALWVVMVHSCLSSIIRDYPHLSQVPLFAFSLWGALGVPIFFVISGYCIAGASLSASKRELPVKYFLVARIRRIYPPYAFATFAGIIGSVILAFLVAHHKIQNIDPNYLHFFGNKPSYYVSALTLMQVPFHTAPLLPQFWTLCYEAAFYIIVAIALAISLRMASRVSVFAITSAITVITLVWLSITPDAVPFPLDMWPEFGLGVTAYGYLLKPQDRNIKFAFWGQAILMAVCAASHEGFHRLGSPSRRVELITCIVFSVLLIALYRHDQRIMRFRIARMIAWVGGFSYSLYLTHTLFIPLVKQIGKRMHVSENTFWILFICEIAVAIGFARLFYLWFERPFIKTQSKRTNSTAA